jgi:hypothetical protein
MSDSDLQAARAFLDGYLERDRHGRLRSRYFVSGSPEELAARRALAKVLRSYGPLDRELRISLAGLFDPDPPEWEQRRLRLKRRDRSAAAQYEANTQVVEHVAAEIKRTPGVNAAIASAAVRFSTITTSALQSQNVGCNFSKRSGPRTRTGTTTRKRKRPYRRLPGTC